MAFKLFTVALLAVLVGMSAEAQSTGCKALTGQAACVANTSCQWFLNACIDKAQKDCTKVKDQNACKNTPGCVYYPQLQWWLPTKFMESNYGDFSAPKIGCDTNTMCDRLTVASWCNGYSHCTWVDGACKTFGTPADPNWNPDCANAGFQPRRKQNCVDLGDKCRYINMNVCTGKNCENVLYGCRNAGWCDVSKGPNLKKQCKLLGDRCSWQDNKCAAVPTAAPTNVPTGSPTKRPSASPTRKPTTSAPSKAPTKAPTSKSPTTGAPTTLSPTRPTTFAPTKAPTAPTTLAPTNRPTTAAPTRRACPVTEGAGSLQCKKHPFAQLDQLFVPPASVVDKKKFCTEACEDGASAGSYGVPVFPGCRAWTFDGTSCRLFGCWVGGTGNFEATVVATAGTTYGVPSAACFNGAFPTQAPTTTCLYTNEANPPVRVTNDRPIEASCRVANASMSRDYVGTNRERLDWCQTSCTNLYGSSCTSTELYAVPANGSPARCIFAKCVTPQTATIVPQIFRSVKTTQC